MKFPNIFNKQSQSDDFDLNNPDEGDEDNHEEVGVGTKVKVISALSVVAMAMVVAWWVQEPDPVHSEVLSATNTRAEEPAAKEIAAETLSNLVAATEDVPSSFEIDVVDFAYSPANIEVAPGTTVNWTNMDQVAHTVTGEEFSSSSLKAGETFTYIFEEPGIYEYYCAFHPQMIGTVTVSGSSLPEEEVADELVEEIDVVVPGEEVLTETIVDEATTTTEDIETLNAAANDSLLGEEYLEPTEVVTMDANQIINAEESEALSPDELTTTGPEEILYLTLAALVMFINRKKLALVFKK